MLKNTEFVVFDKIIVSMNILYDYFILNLLRWCSEPKLYIFKKNPSQSLPKQYNCTKSQHCEVIQQMCKGNDSGTVSGSKTKRVSFLE